MERASLSESWEQPTYAASVEDYRDVGDHIEYGVKVHHSSGVSWTAWRRFSEFENGHKELLASCSTEVEAKCLPECPQKSWLPAFAHSLARDFCEQRQQELRSYLAVLLCNQGLLKKEPVFSLLALRPPEPPAALRVVPRPRGLELEVGPPSPQVFEESSPGCEPVEGSSQGAPVDGYEIELVNLDSGARTRLRRDVGSTGQQLQRAQVGHLPDGCHRFEVAAFNSAGTSPPVSVTVDPVQAAAALALKAAAAESPGLQTKSRRSKLSKARIQQQPRPSPQQVQAAGLSEERMPLQQATEQPLHRIQQPYRANIEPQNPPQMCASGAYLAPAIPAGPSTHFSTSGYLPQARIYSELSTHSNTILSSDMHGHSHQNICPTPSQPSTSSTGSSTSTGTRPVQSMPRQLQVAKADLELLQQLEQRLERHVTPTAQQGYQQTSQGLQASRQFWQQSQQDRGGQDTLSEYRPFASSGRPPLPGMQPSWRVPETKEAENSGDVVDEDEDALCVICLASPKSHAFVPCGHRCICAGCAAGLFPSGSSAATCPVCRADAQHVIQIFT